MNTLASSPWFAPTRALTIALVRHLSVTNTPGETSFAAYLHTLLREQPYFQAHPAQVWTAPIAGDPWGRSNVYALARGRGRATVLLTGHYDVVSAASYGPLADWAADPDDLLPRLIAELTESEGGDAEAQALADLRSGDWLPGRGALDMKSGLAAGLSVLYHFIASGGDGNLLFIATPDEEETSRGIRGAMAELPGVTRMWGLDVVGAINLDATTDRGDGRDGQVVFLGSVGKLLPSVFVVGRETHAGAPFDGVNATRLAAEVTRRVECNPALADWAEGEAAPPPVCLQQTDTKEHYDVTTPAGAWLCFNVLNHQRTPSETLGKMMAIVGEALDAALRELSEHARSYAALAGHAPPPRFAAAPVLTFADLKGRALAHGGAAAAQALDTLTRRLVDKAEIDTPRFCYEITRLLWSYGGLSGPAAVVGLASLAYPTVYVSGTDERQARLRQAVEREAPRLAEELGVAIRPRPFLPGISDMSFIGPQDDPVEQACVAENTPAWGSRIQADETADRLDIPVVNIGPWGRDYHHRLERVYMPYAFGVAPELIWRVVNAVLQN